MPTSTNTIVITYWLVKPEYDLSSLPEIQSLGVNKIYNPQFKSGSRRMLAFAAKFDPLDPNAEISAALYAYRNAKHLASAEHPEAKIYLPKFHIDEKEIKLSEPYD